MARIGAWRAGARRTSAIFVAGVAAFAATPIFAEPIRIGMFRVSSGAPVFLAQERGYFAAEGVPAEIRYFENGPSLAAGVVAGSADFAFSAPTAGFYNLAGQGALKIVAGYTREVPGFHNMALVASRQAFADGLRSVKDLPGHSFAVAAVGSPGHYVLGLLVQKYRLDAASIRLLPVQSVANIASAIAGGQADASATTGATMLPLLRRGDVKLLGWVGDDTPWELGVVFTATRTAGERPETVARFLRAYRRAAREYHDAVTGAGETRSDGPEAAEIVAVLAKHLGEPPDLIRLGLPYVDAEARLDVADIYRQIAWYRSQGLVKDEVDGETIIDRRYVVALPER